MSNTQRNLSWSLSRRPNSSLVANGFPSFKLDSKDVQRGAIKVIAKSPTEQTFPMQVIDDEGLYTTNFTPTEIGDWTISILYEGNHIEGSPFSVRVYDPGQVKIIGLSNGTVGKTSVFHIDTSEAGEGQVAVRVVNRVGTDDIPVDIETDNFGRNIVSFTPRSGGIYKIHVYFAGLEVTGSPFEMTVFDFSEVTVTGSGLGLVPVNQLASFKVNFGNKITDSHRDALIVKIVSSRGVSLPCRITSNMDQSFNVDYMPNEVGDHRVDILYHNQPIIGSPFAVRTYDISKVIVSNIPPSALFGQAITFDIDVDNAGDGDLEIMINEGSVPNTVVSSGDRCYQATFVAKEIKPHIVTLRFNNQMVPGSPWTIDINSNVSVTGSGLSNVPVGKPTTFEVNTGNVQKQVFVKIKAPSGREVKTKCKQKQGISIFEYTPTETGTHEIDIRCDGIARVASSPYYSRAYDTSAIKVTPVGVTGTVGSPVDLFVDVNQAGDGQLEIMINQGFVPNTVRLVSKGIYQVTFSPVNSKTHLVQITFNGNPVPDIKVPIIDQSLIKVQGEGLIQAAVNQTSSFRVDAQKAGDADFSVKITSMTSGNELPVSIRGNAVKGYDVEFITREPGNYKADVRYGGVAINGGPFVIKSFDLSKVRVVGIRDGIVGAKSTFTADVSDAGEGNMKISITSNVNGQNIPNQVQPIQGGGRFEVTFTPVSSGPHRANVTFNERHVPGSPFSFQVFDLAKLSIKGTGVNSVSCNKPSTLTFSAPGTQHTDFDVTVTAPNGQRIIPRVSSNGSDGLTVDFTPTMTGNHSVEVSYCGHPVPSCSYNVQVWDASRVLVSDLQPGQVQKASTFNIDASQAGTGNLEIVITNGNENIPNFVTAEGSGRFRATFTPQSSDQLRISVKFNGESVPGSPFLYSVIDGKKARATGEGLGKILSNKPTSFDIICREVGGQVDKLMTVDVFDSNGESVATQVSRPSSSDFHVTYTPKIIGRYKIEVKYADMEITGSPFYPEVFDPTQIFVSKVPRQGIFAQPVEFDVDTRGAGEGHLTVKVKDPVATYDALIKTKSPGQHSVSFDPRETGPHNICVYFDGQPVPGSPYICSIFDPRNIFAKWDTARIAPVNRPVHINIESKVPLMADVVAKVVDPYGADVPVQVIVQGSTSRIVEFIPREVGPFRITLTCVGVDLLGSPFTCNAFDASRVHIQNAVRVANVLQPVSFSVDTSEAGVGDVDVEVTYGGIGGGVAGQNRIAVRRQQSNAFSQLYTFQPTLPIDHLVTVLFNKELVVGSPMLIRVCDDVPQSPIMPLLSPTMAVNETFSTANMAANGDLSDARVNVTAPNGELVSAYLVQQPDGEYKIQYSSPYTGKHRVEIVSGGQRIMGSPFNVEIFDANKVRVNGKKSSAIGEKVELDVIHRDAGEAELGVKVVGPRGNSVPFDISKTENGHHIVYSPNSPGTYQVYATYGGQDIPGCPIKHEVYELVRATAHGEGLTRGIKDQISTFVVDSKGQRGDLVVQVDGPNSIARCNIDPGSNGVYRVSFIPLETGNYNVFVRFNGQEVNGSPFHPKVVDPSKVFAVGGWDSLIDRNNRMRLNPRQINRLELDTSRAGPGTLTAEIVSAQGSVPVDVSQTDNNRHLITFVPREDGDYIIKAFWNGEMIPRCPITATTVSSTSIIKPEKVIMTGQGLTLAKVDQRAEFVIDGSAAGPGTPDVRLIGISNDIPVRVTSIGQDIYRCIYEPSISGAYLLKVQWSGQQVVGSPFKVNVVETANASQVICSGEGLRKGILGHEIKCLIDTRNAGPGELAVQCTGPNRSAISELTDHRDGTFTLQLKPLETGRHKLEIKYSGEHVPGSPFTLKVSSPPDASKVKVFGPGIQHGLLVNYHSHFTVDTTGAGAGQLTVRIRGPRGAFCVEMQRDYRKDRLILCRYDPAEIGDYIIHIKWSGTNIPGSPFHVRIFDTQAELEKFVAESAFLDHSNFDVRDYDD